MPPRKKSAPHDRSNNNSQGLAAPAGRRIAKQKSNGQLNGHPNHPNGHPKLPSPPAAPAANVLDSSSASAPSSDAALVNGTSADAKMGVSYSHPNGRPRMPSGASEDDLEAHAAGPRTPGCGSPLRIDVHSAGKSTHKHHRSTITLAKTILTACPLWDVIAILIILLQLPPTIISVIHFLFVTLTFVTPATTSLSNLPSINEILLGSGGAPSLPVIISLDVIVLVIFCMTTVPMQNISLDIAQAVIAISLGGAAASKGGTTRSVVWCLAIIILSHVFRWRPARQLGVSLLWTGLIKTGFQPVSQAPSVSGSPNRLQIRPGFPRSLLGVHILVQALVRVVRRYLLWRDAESPSASNIKKVDPESGTGSALNTPRTSTVQFESANDSASTVSTSTDGRPPGPSPAPRDGKERSSSSRKKRRQATHVRSQQPFWAALASTKVTFIKELEQSQASIDAVEANSADLAHVGSADFTSGGERAWIRDIGSSEISFGLTLPSPSGKGTTQDDESDTEAANVSKTRPFFVRLNGAGWSSVKIEEVGHKLTSDTEVDVWLGKIFGLTAYSPYHIEFVRLEDDSSIYAASLITLPAPSTEQASAASAPSQTLRPSSPTTTLKNSIAAADQTLDTHRNRLKRNRKDHKTQLSSIQKEVDNLSSRLNSSGGSDERFRARSKQLEQSIRRADEEAAQLEADITSLGDIPECDVKRSADKRAALRKERDAHESAVKAYKAAKAEADKELSQVQSELQSVQQKHQKSQQRNAKFSQKHDNLISAKAQVQQDKMRRAIDRNSETERRAQEEQKWLNFIAQYEHDAHIQLQKVAQLKAQATHFEDTFNKNQAIQHAQQYQSVPTTPEGALPGTLLGTAGNRNSYPFQHNPFSGFQFPAMGNLADSVGPMPPPNGHHHSNPSSIYHNHLGNAQQRGRSSSMLSGISDFTDDTTDALEYQQHQLHMPLPGLLPTASGFQPTSAFSPAAIGAFRDRRKSSQGSGSLRGGSVGSGSASGSSGNSSTLDSMSPSAKSLSPVGSGALQSPISPLAKSSLAPHRDREGSA